MPQSFNCPSCGGTINYIESEAATIQCNYCHTTVVVPESWRKSRDADKPVIIQSPDTGRLIDQMWERHRQRFDEIQERMDERMEDARQMMDDIRDDPTPDAPLTVTQKVTSQGNSKVTSEVRISYSSRSSRSTIINNGAEPVIRSHTEVNHTNPSSAGRIRPAVIDAPPTTPIHHDKDWSKEIRRLAVFFIFATISIIIILIAAGVVNRLFFMR